MEQSTDAQLTIPGIENEDYLTVQGLDSLHRKLGFERDEHLEIVAALHVARFTIRAKKQRKENPDQFRPTDEVHEP